MTLRIGPFLEFGTVRGEPIQVAGRTFVPVARVLSVAIGRHGAPMAGGITWVRPVAVEEVNAAGSRRLAIPYRVRSVVLGIMVAAALLQLRHFFRRAPSQSRSQGGSNDDPAN